MMRVLFIGLGSIAGRHIQNLKAMLGDGVSIDVLRSGKGRAIDEEVSACLSMVTASEEKLAAHYDALFITNPTSLHYDTLMKHHDRSDAFFIEKPVFVSGEEDLQPFKKVPSGNYCDANDGIGDTESDKIYYVACPLRYTNAIQWLKNNLDFSKVHSMRVISSSYLPDWRSWADYRNSYSAHKDMGGGVSIDLIHEWDYISNLIGFPNTVQCIISKKSTLAIDSDDIAVYIAEYEDKVVELHLDYFGRKAVRRIELFTKDDTIVTDLIDQKIQWLSAGKELSLIEDRDSYQKKELEQFLRIVNGDIDSNNGLEVACRVLRLARGIA